MDRSATAALWYQKIESLYLENTEIIQRISDSKECIRYLLSAKCSGNSVEFQLREQTKQTRLILDTCEENDSYNPVDDIFNVNLRWYPRPKFDDLVTLHHRSFQACNKYKLFGENLLCQKHLHSHWWNFEQLRSLFGDVEHGIVQKNDKELEEMESLVARMQKSINKVLSHPKVVMDRNWFRFSPGILNDNHTKVLSEWTHAEWQPFYKSSTHGTTLFEMLQRIQDHRCPYIIVFKTDKNYLFGAYLEKLPGIVCDQCWTDKHQNFKTKCCSEQYLTIFLFTLENPQGIPPSRTYSRDVVNQTVCRRTLCSLEFNHFLSVKDSPQFDKVECQFDEVEECPFGFNKKYYEIPPEAFTGSEKALITDFEVLGKRTSAKTQFSVLFRNKMK